MPVTLGAAAGRQRLFQPEDTPSKEAIATLDPNGHLPLVAFPVVDPQTADIARAATLRRAAGGRCQRERKQERRQGASPRSKNDAIDRRTRCPDRGARFRCASEISVHVRARSRGRYLT